MTRLLPAPDGLSPDDLACVLEALRAGEPVALPTETVYGLAAPALNPAACQRIFSLKNRPLSDPLICHLPDAAWLEKMTDLPPGSRFLVQKLTAAFWPGPLTLVLPRSGLVPDIVTAGQPTVALRQSAHPVFRQIIGAFGEPLAAPSANRFGRISPTQAAHVIAELSPALGMVVDGGPCRHGLESTIVGIRGEVLEILRPGPILTQDLESFGPVRQKSPVAEIAEAPSQQDSSIVPGGLASHYAPATCLQIHLCGETPAASPELGVLAWKELPPGPWGAVEILTPSGTLEEAASGFYAALRRLDESGVLRIVAELPPAGGLGDVLRERLSKAAAAHRLDSREETQPVP